MKKKWRFSWHTFAKNFKKVMLASNRVTNIKTLITDKSKNKDRIWISYLCGSVVCYHTCLHICLTQKVLGSIPINMLNEI